MIVNPLKVQWNFGNFNPFTLIHESFLTVLVFLNPDLVVLSNFLHLSYVPTIVNRKVLVYIFWSEHFCNDKVVSHRFPKLLSYGSPEEYEEPIAEYNDFQLVGVIAILSSEMKIIKLAKNTLLDCLRHYLSTLKDCIGFPNFLVLSTVAMLIFVIPHSNAKEEHVFFASQKE